MDKIDTIANDELEIFRLNFSRYAKRDIASLKPSNLPLLDVFGSVVLSSNRASTLVTGTEVLAYNKANLD